MKILILRHDIPRRPDQDENDLLADLDVIRAAEGIQRALDSRGFETRLEAVRRNVMDVLLRYDPNEWLIFNLVETLEGMADLEPYVPAMYDYLGFTYTACDARTNYNCLHKDRAKGIMTAHGIPTPRYQVMRSPDEPIDVPLPAIVKPVAEDGSIGIRLNAVGTTPAEVRERVELVLSKHLQPALVEEYIEGREFYVGVWGNDPVEVLPLSEMDFSRIADPMQRITSYEVKWEEGTELFDATPAICPAVVDDALAERIRTITRQAFQALGCRDYGHVDIRVRDSQPYLLEVNPACDLSEGMGFARQARVAGCTYPETVERIVRFASARSGGRF
ncbi:MAG: ATP-grasp domain-containing protein [Chloroflexi bacterium]|nr:ATP-grasp domain-containing protein [Chloroflexota bacterium]